MVASPLPLESGVGGGVSSSIGSASAASGVVDCGGFGFLGFVGGGGGGGSFAVASCLGDSDCFCTVLDVGGPQGWDYPLRTVGMVSFGEGKGFRPEDGFILSNYYCYPRHNLA